MKPYMTISIKPLPATAEDSSSRQPGRGRNHPSYERGRDVRNVSADVSLRLSERAGASMRVKTSMTENKTGELLPW